MFKRGQITALVATEVAARGLDIKELPQVVNYELPNVPEDYVHRIGRTGRAGAAGEAISLVSGDETGLLRDIERVLRRSIPVVPTPVFKIVESAPLPSQGNRNGGHERSGERSGGDRPHHSGNSHGNRGGGRRGGSSGGGRSQGQGQQQRGRSN